jgi:hypothetical protein
MKVWISKYALSQGILETEVKRTSVEGMVQASDVSLPTYFHGWEWHSTWEEAAQRAEELKEKRLKSLQKQIRKLENLHFTK